MYDYLLNGYAHWLLKDCLLMLALLELLVLILVSRRHKPRLMFIFLISMQWNPGTTTKGICNFYFAMHGFYISMS